MKSDRNPLVFDRLLKICQYFCLPTNGFNIVFNAVLIHKKREPLLKLPYYIVWYKFRLPINLEVVNHDSSVFSGLEAVNCDALRLGRFGVSNFTLGVLVNGEA